MSILELTIFQIYEAYRKGELQPADVVAAYIQRYEETKEINAFIEHFTAKALEQAKNMTIQADSAPLSGVVGALKDNFAVKGKGLSCASKLLSNYISPYDSSVAKQLASQQFINLGRLNMDEFAMGSTGRYSAYGPTLNPLDIARVPGGSSGGSAASVASRQALFSMGSDTGGSSRLPASYTGVCGFKPSYGAISRYGLNAFAPSFDVPGIIAHTPLDIAMVYQAILNDDSRDQTKCQLSFNWKDVKNNTSLKGLKIGLFESLLVHADADVIKAFNQVKGFLLEAGVEFITVDLDGLDDLLIKVYYILTSSEAASTLSRFDGARYGQAIEEATIEELISQSRGQQLGHEVQRRILMGNYFLMAENYQSWYQRALNLRAQLVAHLNALSQQKGAAVWLWPGFHEAALINAPEKDNYTSDMVGVLANLYGGSSVALPITTGSNQLPVSVQIAGAIGNDQQVLSVANTLYKEMNWRNLKY